jgi:hypothetical protein
MNALKHILYDRGIFYHLWLCNESQRDILRDAWVGINIGIYYFPWKTPPNLLIHPSLILLCWTMLQPT